MTHESSPRPAQTEPPPLLPGSHPSERHAFLHYLGQHMGATMRLMMLTGAVAYFALVACGELVGHSGVPLLLRAAPLLPLVVIAWRAFFIADPLRLSVLGLVAVVVVEVGIGLNGYKHSQGALWVLPAYVMVPLATGAVWLWRWDFILAMALSVLGPLPLLLADPAMPTLLAEYLMYMGIALVAAVIVHSLMDDVLHKHFRLEQQLRERAYTDDLTGLLARNRFLELAAARLAHTVHQGGPVCALYLDADHFKQINDRHGHALGDQTLVALADVMRHHLRPLDLIGRVGGEEFAVLLPGLAQDEAVAVAERIRQAMHGIRLPDGTLTVSIGVAAQLPEQSLHELLAAADAALRQAKRNGRDRVEIAGTLSARFA
ncbi:diguanylate cyclase (GGDEF) domain-containing protein [Mizugakiibacter sediminis]|uniref:diguanylate cyclase n=1 Tax=Mizugakiibacter sediminis TaxID=1475481 RepID=A0A0K8QLA0_9GAMM|nr:GGDEF domain-containing protein [Mizugakiibacter sediminis]GAP65207.1 diguanylate cyclase (GGDEF) domain-containing protein [Mizugakiibacter sediminis]